jgi:hypothetical protein
VCKGKAGLASHMRWKHSHGGNESNDPDLGAAEPLHRQKRRSSGQTPISSKFRYCERTFHTVPGRTLHERRVHPHEFHADFVPPALVKARWSDTEMALVAREEVEESRLVGRRAKVADIAAHFPHRTFDSMKSLRRTEGYRRILAEERQRLERLHGELMLPEESDGEAEEAPPPCPPDFSPKQVTRGEAEGDQSVVTSPCTDSVDNPTVDVRDASETATLHDMQATEALLACVTSSRQEICLEDYKYDALILLLREGGNLSLAELQLLVDEEYENWLKHLEMSHGPRSRPKPPKRAGKVAKAQGGCRTDAADCPVSRKQERRRQYREVQRLYKKNRTRCAELVLSGDWSKSPKEVGIEEQEAFWGPLVQTPSKPDDRIPQPLVGPIHEIIAPVTREEYKQTLKETCDSSPGVDGMSRAYLRLIADASVVVHMNLWLAPRRPPRAFKEGITSLIPKNADSSQPAEFRPITMSVMVARQFHRLLAARLERLVPLSPRQKAFRRGDGLADNAVILRSLIKDRCDQSKGLSVAFIDVAKAIDTVSQESILAAARRLGVPEALVNYLRNLYDEGFITFKCGRQRGSVVYQVRRGVRQGDLLSALLFNFVMDWLLSTMDANLGVEVGPGVRCCHLAFADDLTLMSETPEGLVRLAHDFETALASVRLMPNPLNSSTLRILQSGRRKQWVVDPKLFLQLGGGEVPTTDILGYYKYLGLSMTAGRVHPMAQDRLRRHLKKLDKVPLKPQQSMYLLRTHVLPGLPHLLVLDPCTRTMLRKMDVSVRKNVRKWVRLPHDTSNAFIHAPAREGGLGVGTLVLNIPLLKRDRVDSQVRRAVSETDPVLVAVVRHSAWLRREIERWSTPMVYARLPMTSKENVKAALAWSLHSSVDGRGLRYHSLVPGSQDWVVNGSVLQSGRDNIRSIRMTSGTLQTAVRAARGTPGANVKCDACGEVESLAHVVQTCAWTARPRTQRNDSVVQWIQERFARTGRQVLVEASIPTTSGIRRPDLVVYVPEA